MYRQHGERLEFLWVYVREAHPEEGWVSPVNEREGVRLDDPATIEARRARAAMACETLSLTIPCLLDDMDDSVMTAYAGWPDRIFVIDQDRTVRYVGRRGPVGFRTDEALRFLEKHTSRQLLANG